MKTLSLVAISAFVVACSIDPGAPDQARERGAGNAALTTAECNYFDVSGKVRICHATGSAKNPFNILQVSDSGCINGHAGHANDYVATATDLDCHGGGCFPAGAPVDAKIQCCPGLVAQNGVCTDLCAHVTCGASDRCHVAGSCNPLNGSCSNPAAPDATACNDGNAGTTSDTCQAGVCVGGCTSGTNLCGSTCLDLSSDPSNCGSCGTSCAGGQACTAGACVTTNPCARVPGSSAFGGQCYLVVHNVDVSVAGSESACVTSYGGHLASVHSQAENDFLGNLIDPAQAGFITAVIGGLAPTSFCNGAGGWTDGTPWDYTNWRTATGEPNAPCGSPTSIQLWPANPVNSGHIPSYSGWNDISANLLHVTDYVCEFAPADPCAGTPPTPAPAHDWTFNDGTAGDSAGGANGTLLGGATISNGKLVLDNTSSASTLGFNGQRMQAPLADTTGVKTLVTWVSLGSLTQHGGSGLTIEDTLGGTINPFTQRFDSIDYAERVAGQWMSGSDNFARSSPNNGGAAETSTAEVMVAIVYDTDNSVALYHDGVPYGASYVQGALQSYGGGATDALLGLRHSGCSNNCWLTGSIDEARIYDSALTACQIKTLTPVP
jgi:hypothetical protein